MPDCLQSASLSIRLTFSWKLCHGSKKSKAYWPLQSFLKYRLYLISVSVYNSCYSSQLHNRQCWGEPDGIPQPGQWGRGNRHSPARRGGGEHHWPNRLLPWPEAASHGDYGITDNCHLSVCYLFLLHTSLITFVYTCISLFLSLFLLLAQSLSTYPFLTARYSYLLQADVLAHTYIHTEKICARGEQGDLHMIYESSLVF